MDVSVSGFGVNTVFTIAPGPVVAVTVIGEPVRPVDDTVSVCAPDAPRVHVVLTWPLAFVLFVCGVTDPPPLATVKVTCVPATALPFASVTCAMIGCASAWPSVPV